MCSSNCRNNEKGFTIVELIVMLVLIGILTYVAISELSDSSSSIKSKTLAKKIITDVRYAQEMAMSHCQTTKFLVESAQNKYSLKWGDDSYLKTPMGGQNFINYKTTTSGSGILK